jgi:alpha-L-rhamnosidase
MKIFWKNTCLVMVMGVVALAGCQAQAQRWRKGILTDEFIFTKAPFPSCHASTLALTPGGMVAAWFGGTKEGNPDVCIWVSRLIGGKWSAPVNVANGILSDSVRYPCYNPVLYQVPGGPLLLFYKIGPRPSAWKGWMKTSHDNGVTWSKARALPDGILGPVKDKPVLLSNGDLLCGSSTEDHGWHVHFEITHDFGKTWWRTPDIGDSGVYKAIQPTILIHKDGRLQALCRSENRAILQTWSSDNGRTWTPLRKTNLPNNNSGIDAVTLHDGRQLLVYNPTLGPDGKPKGPRTPLNVSVSEDGERWSAAAVLEDSPISQYSYPAVIQTPDGLVHIVYTWRRERIKYVVIDPKKLELTPLNGQLWPK